MLIPLGFLAASGAGVDSNFVLLDQRVLTGTEANVTFSNLNTYASTYKHLQLRIVARTNRSAGGDDLSIQFNGDTAANYGWHRLSGDGSSVSSEGLPSLTWMGNFGVPGATFTADAYGAQVTDILDAFSTTKNKTIRSLAGRAGNSNDVNLSSGHWRNTAAISELRVFLRLGTSYVSGSRFSLYGVK